MQYGTFVINILISVWLSGIHHTTWPYKNKICDVIQLKTNNIIYIYIYECVCVCGNGNENKFR